MADDNLDHFLSLIIPVYKQEATIVRNIREIKQALDKIRYPYELIVVIDGLIDKSYDKLKKAKIPNAKIIVYKKNHGKSYAIRAGMNKAKGDYVMFIDSGMEIDPNGISMLLEHMEWYNADIIVGSKRHPASLINYSRSRRILSFGYYYLVRLLFGVNVRDTQAGIKIFKKELIKKVLPRLVEKRFAGDLEILVVAKTLGYHRIFEAPIKLDYKLGKITSAANLTAIWKILFDTLAIFYRSRILKSYNQSLKNK
ncbi:hypothetical protein A2313_04515 [Candidatus Roizmanbacteria bacterium RIFOXYB2_FULL_41_10]|uniref:Glycosyltransferase 2-like domain-containing protein n=1 Tax=Candidatus Roizmanbacteria bacterium RIFOXYA1_FULL_41_12 TaxID=1802082 RepID=A0A1F7K255_9BACT|nr:MAG: hypothetical protein A2209_05020 [Candidatus Roizmanbacteria bacterium RIFOXYA1_FULL_41_12]OGK66242.1 MAG: hypothetical protein A2262_02340 [Candidatus Roizmanbacteria bacterium RIFOXYA2_FULL_41_8]OGK66917.1 MAG: hypothetical protein A2377_03400 [Candidatus Roizmanbacteria bacterium RIFOXYB1_FULL_41_27]OGK70710.1 MAG: hypothetical protein A2403_01305 [Candidatus Roizmanbacteria bacterium RIFOXYC1_FULL_41_16]OGK71590.1 MAG: hypothetical protein A2313_04515 [Candidatus Roizmanbacteria bac